MSNTRGLQPGDVIIDCQCNRNLWWTGVVDRNMGINSSPRCGTPMPRDNTEPCGSVIMGENQYRGKQTMKEDAGNNHVG